MNNYQKALQKIQTDQKCRPLCCFGPTGPRGPIGPTGPAGPTLIRSAYLVTFNNGTTSDGVAVESQGRVPIDRLELDPTNLLTLNTDEETITFNKTGYYKINFTVSAYPEVKGVDFDPTTDIVSVGIRQINTDNVYVGVGEWVFNGEAVELVANGILAVQDTSIPYELVNLGNSKIFLHTPDIRNLSTVSYFSNPLVTILIEYLGK